MLMLYDLELCTSDILDFARSHDIVNEGTIQDQIIFHGLNLHNIKIVKSEYYIVFENCKFNQLLLRKCENIQFRQCNAQNLILSKSKGITIKDMEFNRGLKLMNSNINAILSCKIYCLRIFASFNNKFEECEITHALNRFSRANTFRHVKILDSNMQNLIEGYFGIRDAFLTIAIVGGLAIAVVSSLFQEIIELSDTFMFIVSSLAISLIGSIILFLLVRFYIDYKKSKKYEPNELIL